MTPIQRGLLQARYRSDVPKFDKIEPVQGECYHNVYKFMDSNPYDGWTVVHGIAVGQGPIKGVKHGHAWVEKETSDGTWVYDPSFDVLVMLPFYYQEGNITNTVKYKIKEFFRNIVDSEHSGPWDSTIGLTSQHALAGVL